MTHANDVDLVRVYSRELGGTIADEYFSKADLDAGTVVVEIAVECEAGQTIHDGGGPYTISIFVRDLMENHEIDHTDSITGTLGDPDWNDKGTTFTFSPVPPGVLQQGHVYNVLSVLSVGAANPNVSFEESPMFIIT